MTNMTLLTGHPLSDSFNGALADAYARGARAAGATVTTIDVTTLDFDPVLRGAYRTRLADEPDLARVRAAIEQSAHVAWFFPTWWAGPPAVVKGLVDRLFLPGWAFRFEGRALPTGLLAGRSARWVTTMDSPRWWYLVAHHDAMGGAFERGTLRFVGFGPIERTVITSVRTLEEEARTRWVTKLEALGARDARRAIERAPAALPASAQRTSTM